MALVAGIGGVMLGFVLGWTARQRVTGPLGAPAERTSRLRALEEEQGRLAAEQARMARELDRRERALTELTQVAQATDAIAHENQRLLMRIGDLEAALTTATAEDLPGAELAVQLAMALKERDVAQRALLAVHAEAAVRDSAAPTPSFPALPPDPGAAGDRALDEDPDATLPPPDEDWR